MADHSTIRKIKKVDEEAKELNELAQSSLEEANSLQMDLETLSKRMMTKLLSVVQEFMVLKRPLYNKRHAALSAVPHFWAIAVIENDDVRSGYQVVFTFDINPYFYNCELVKQNVYENGNLSTLKTNIDWKENMNISSERKVKGKKRGPPIENFFDWLQRSSNNKHDFICDIIKDDLWTDPLKYFFVPDDTGDDNSESESDEEEYYEDMMDSNEDESHDEETGEHEEKQNIT